MWPSYDEFRGDEARELLIIWKCERIYHPAKWEGDQSRAAGVVSDWALAAVFNLDHLVFSGVITYQ